MSPDWFRRARRNWGHRHTDLSELLAPIVRTISEDERRQKDEEEPHHSKHCRSIGWDRTDPGWQPRTAHHWRSALRTVNRALLGRRTWVHHEPSCEYRRAPARRPSGQHRRQRNAGSHGCARREAGATFGGRRPVRPAMITESTLRRKSTTAIARKTAPINDRIYPPAVRSYEQSNGRPAQRPSWSSRSTCRLPHRHKVPSRHCHTHPSDIR